MICIYNLNLGYMSTKYIAHFVIWLYEYLITYSCNKHKALHQFVLEFWQFVRTLSTYSETIYNLRKVCYYGFVVYRLYICMHVINLCSNFFSRFSKDILAWILLQRWIHDKLREKQVYIFLMVKDKYMSIA